MKRLSTRLLSAVTALTFASTLLSSAVPVNAVSGQPTSVTLVPKNVVNFMITDEDGEETIVPTITVRSAAGKSRRAIVEMAITA